MVPKGPNPWYRLEHILQHMTKHTSGLHARKLYEDTTLEQVSNISREGHASTRQRSAQCEGSRVNTNDRCSYGLVEGVDSRVSIPELIFS